jgi:uncharacterized protein
MKIKAKVEPLKCDREGRTELHYAACDGDLIKVQKLILSGANVIQKDKLGVTPLHFAAQSQSSQIISLLLDSGAEVDARDDNGNTPLSDAVFYYRSDGSSIQILRRFGADPNLENNYGQTPLNLARLIANYDVAKYFDDLD